LLTLEYLKAKEIPVLAGIFNGDFSVGVKETIQAHSVVRWLNIDDTQMLNPEFIRAEANKIRPFIADFR